MKQSKHKYSYDKSSKKFPCPVCHKKRFVLWVNNDTGEYVNKEVGKCDRGNECRHKLSPWEWNGFSEYEKSNRKSIVKENNQVINEPKTKSYIQAARFNSSLEESEKSNFAIYLNSIFGKEVASSLLTKYKIGTSQYPFPNSTIFWQIDSECNVRTGRQILYDPITGKRSKRDDSNPFLVHPKNDFNLVQCFFGEHLLEGNTESQVCLVEAEKTAVIASHYFPKKIWLATGGKNGCRWRDYQVNKVLRERDICLVPDFGFAEKGKTCFQLWSERAGLIRRSMSCNISVSTILEDAISEYARGEDYDLADLLLNKIKRGRMSDIGIE